MSSTTNSEGLHFHEGVENINENNKKTSRTCTVGAKIEGK